MLTVTVRYQTVQTNPWVPIYQEISKPRACLPKEVKKKVGFFVTNLMGFVRGSPYSVFLVFSQSYVQYDLRKNKIVVLFFC
jgi:hypothetical protein